MKKILITITTLFGGGAERVVSVWANQLADTGYAVTLLLYGRSDNEYIVRDKVTIRTVAPTYEEYKQLGYLNRLKRMRRIIRAAAPDVVINFLPRMQIWMLLASWGLRLRRIETVRVSPWEVCRGRKAEHFLWMLCFRRADAVILQTPEQAEYFARTIRKKCVVIPNPVAEPYRRMPKQHYADNTVHFVAAGRITEQKNYPLMLDAFARAKQICQAIRLSIYGTGTTPYTAKIQQYINTKGLTDAVRLMGRAADMLPILQQADAFILTSDYEGMPNALIEAMAVGLPCISTDCRTGPRDLIAPGENGFLVPTGDAEQIAAAIIKTAQLRADEAARIGQQARRRILALCSEENSLRRLIDIIESAAWRQT